MKKGVRVTPILFLEVCSLVTLLLFFGACQSNEPGVAPPVIITEEPSSITLNSAILGGRIEYAQPELISGRGVVWGRNPSPELQALTDNTTDGSGSGSFKSTLTNLSLYKYYVRAYAKIQGQVFYGNEVILDINSIIPVIATAKVTSGSAESVEAETTISYTHSAPIIEKGICWSSTRNPTVNFSTKVVDASSTKTFRTTISVSPWTPYYIRGYVITEVGEFYSNDLHVVIIPAVTLGEVTDIDGNTYSTTRIGTKVWMAENLKVTRFNEGTAIEVASSTEQFKTAKGAMYTPYEGNSENLKKFGYLYNGYTVTGSQNVCMTGWHVPSTADWADLSRSLGGMENSRGPHESRFKFVGNAK